MTIIVPYTEIEKAMRELEIAKKNGFVACDVTFTPVHLDGPNIECALDNLIMKAHPRDQRQNWGAARTPSAPDYFGKTMRFPPSYSTMRVKGNFLVPIEGIDPAKVIEPAEVPTPTVEEKRASAVQPDGLVHAGMGSDLMALCGKILGSNGTDQVKLSYVSDQVTCVHCLRLTIGELKQKGSAPEDTHAEEGEGPEGTTGNSCEVPGTQRPEVPKTRQN